MIVDRIRSLSQVEQYKPQSFSIHVHNHRPTILGKIVPVRRDIGQCATWLFQHCPSRGIDHVTTSFYAQWQELLRRTDEIAEPLLQQTFRCELAYREMRRYSTFSSTPQTSTSSIGTGNLSSFTACSMIINVSTGSFPRASFFVTRAKWAPHNDIIQQPEEKLVGRTTSISVCTAECTPRKTNKASAAVDVLTTQLDGIIQQSNAYWAFQIGEDSILFSWKWSWLAKRRRKCNRYSYFINRLIVERFCWGSGNFWVRFNHGLQEIWRNILRSWGTMVWFQGLGLTGQLYSTVHHAYLARYCGHMTTSSTDIGNGVACF